MKVAMKKRSASQSAFFNPRVLLGLAIFFTGILLTFLATANPQDVVRESDRQLTPHMDNATQVLSAPAGGVQEQWVARYNGPGNGVDRPAAIPIDTSGNVYVTGTRLGSDTGNDYTTIKYDSAGQEVWVARYNGPANDDDQAYAIALDASGNVYVTGESLGLDTGYDYATVKYNAAGQEQWVARYDGPSMERSFDGATAIAVDKSGNAYVTGNSGSDLNGQEYATIKYNSAGQPQWVARYNGPANRDDLANGIYVDASNNVYVTGGSFGPDDFDYATIKYNPDGEEVWVARYEGPWDDFAEAISTDRSGNVYV